MANNEEKKAKTEAELEEENRKLREELDLKNEEEAKRERKEKFNKIMNVVLWIVLLIWIFICLFDFFRVQKEKDPVFCLTTMKETDFDDGTVKSCVGLGYKYVNSKNRSTCSAIQYGPFWADEDLCKKDEN